MVENIQGNEVPRINRASPKTQQTTPVAGDQSFAEVLKNTEEVRFSNHAQKRLQRRNIELDTEGLDRLSAAVEKVERRGGRESLVLMDDMAFIVNVKDRLVVTALDANSRGEGVFTQIDSVVLADNPYENQEE